MWMDQFITFGLENEGGSLITRMALAHPIQSLNSRPRNMRRTCGLDDVFPPDNICSCPEMMLIYIHIYTYPVYIRVLVIGRIYTYTGSVVQYWCSCTPSQSKGLILIVCDSFAECHLLFSLVSPIASCFMINRLILGCLWPLVFVLNNILTPGILRFAISHPLGWFWPLDLLSEYRIQHGNNWPLYVTSS